MERRPIGWFWLRPVVCPRRTCLPNQGGNLAQVIARLRIISGVLFVGLAIGVTSGISAGSASASSCVPEDREYVCAWNNASLAPGNRDWFNASNPFRNWQFQSAFAGGGNPSNAPHIKVCVGGKNGNGVLSAVACGKKGVAEGYTKANERPSWIYMAHHSTAYRQLHGVAYHYPDPQ